MKLYYCGFNGFQQILNEEKTIPKLTEVDLKSIGEVHAILDADIYCNWSYNILKINNKYYKIGYSSSRGESVKENLPLDKINVKNIICDDDQIMLLSTDGTLFNYKDHVSLVSIDKLCEANTLKQDESHASCDPRVVIHIDRGKNFIAFVTATKHFYIHPTINHKFEDEDIVELRCGFEHALLLTAEGNVYSWGSGSRGQLGHGELSNEDVPRLIEALAGIKIHTISAGGWHSCAVGPLGDLYTWGWNDKGQLGLPVAGSKTVADSTKHICTEKETYNVMAIPKLINFTDETLEVLNVSSGSAHTVIYCNDSNLYGTGWNKYSQIGINTGDLEIVQQFYKIETGFEFGPNFKLKCGPWCTSLIVL